MLSFLVSVANAGPREQARRIHDRLVGTPPTVACLNQLENDINTSGANAAALDAIDDQGTGDECTDASFYNVTLKNFVTPWTNEDQTVFAPLNDYTATVIGMIRDDVPFNTVLSADLVYVGKSGLGLPAYSMTNNDLYEAIEDQGIDLKANLVAVPQSSVTDIPAAATAGVITSRAASEAFFIAGTNRAMFRFTLMNHLCTDLEQIKDTTRPPDRIRQDVSRSPGGDSRIFLNSCVGCHSGMDPMAQAFAYYNYDETLHRLVYTANQVQPKYLINADNFKYGYITPDDHWDNYWRNGPNALLGWSSSLSGSGSGAKSLGTELENSDAFAYCQVEKVFKTVCFHPPGNTADRTEVDSVVAAFKASNYNMKTVFAQTAAYCMGD